MGRHKEEQRSRQSGVSSGEMQVGGWPCPSPMATALQGREIRNSRANTTKAAGVMHFASEKTNGNDQKKQVSYLPLVG